MVKMMVGFAIIPNLIRKRILAYEGPKASKSSTKNVLAFLLIAVVVGSILLWSVTQVILPYLNSSGFLGSSTPLPLPSNPSFNPSPNGERDEALVSYALSLINFDREAYGLENVALSDVNSGQIHAEDMLRNSFFSHWDLNGYKPYMRYSLAGGKGAVAENIAAMYSHGPDLKGALAELERLMMYEDAEWDWGHRDNILNPFHNKVSIGVAYDALNLYFVEDFEDDHINWETFTVNNYAVTMNGTFQESGYIIRDVAIYYDNATSLTIEQFNNSPYNGSYNRGTFVGLALPPNWRATGGVTITAEEWSQTGDSFQINFDISRALSTQGAGVYTLYLVANVENNATDTDTFTSYSVWYQG